MKDVNREKKGKNRETQKINEIIGKRMEKGRGEGRMKDEGKGSGGERKPG